MSENPVYLSGYKLLAIGQNDEQYWINHRNTFIEYATNYEKIVKIDHIGISNTFIFSSLALVTVS